jgi:hypothetical protein
MNIMETASESDSSHESELESLELVDDLKRQIAGFVPAIEQISKEVAALQARAGQTKPNPLTDELPIQARHVVKWSGLTTARPVNLLRALLETGTVKTDLETRRIWLQPTVAEQLHLPATLSLYELIRALFKWFGL